MEQPSDQQEINKQLRDKIMGLGETSIRKSYYSELQHRLAELERFRALLDQSKNIIFLVRQSDGVIEDITNAVEIQLGFTSEQLIGTPVFDLFASEYAVGMREYFNQYHDLSDEFHVIGQIRKADGSRIPMEFFMSFVEFTETRFVIGVAQEITERIKAENRIQDQLEYLKALHEIDQIINSSMDRDTSLTSMLEQIVQVLHVDAACVLGIQPDKSLKYLAWTGFRKGSLANIPDGHLKFGTEIRSNFEKQVFFPYLDDFDSVFKASPIVQQEDFHGFISQPLIVRGKLKGALEIFHRSALPENGPRADFVESLAAQAAIAVDKSQLLLDLQQSFTDLQSAYDHTLEGWALALELRERETGQHTKRVQELTCLLSEQAGITGEDLVQFRRGALLHDIGKMGIPDQILLKPGPLDPEEWIIMRKHPEYAYEMLSNIDFLRPCLDIPYCHHEKWDGSGYPRGLSKLQIPLSARIFSVIDVWDALLSDRSYRKAWPRQRTIDYILCESGKHFDPEIVALFSSFISSNKI